MALLIQPDEDRRIEKDDDIKSFLDARGISFQRWVASKKFDEKANQETILKAYAHELEPFMKKYGFESADVINVNPKTEGIEEIRQKFLREHTHSEDEVRFFVEGSGDFWFHLESGEVFCVHCKAGDFLSVPKGVKHWFDLAPEYRVKAIRIFQNKEGWVPHYTDSGIDARYVNS